AAPYGIDGALLRVWGDAITDAQIDAMLAREVETYRRHYGGDPVAGTSRPWTALALSGGGPDGAYGAGLLAGWTVRGDRPVFDTVTGVSTGAVIALFAFLGPQYDPALREIYTGYETSDLVTPRLFSGITSGTSLLDVAGYRALIEFYVDDDVVQALATAYGDGRNLLIGTTNIDAARPVVWNLTAIAASGDPQAKRLIHDVIQASSAIPGAFPPVLIPVVAGDQAYDEMHVDGGATQQVMVFSPRYSVREVDETLGVVFERSVYVVFNNKLSKPYDPVRPRLPAIAGRAASSLIGGSSTGDLYRLYAVAQRDGVALNFTAIPRDFDPQPAELFDPVYMGKLYALGYRNGLVGTNWRPHPPDFAP
ncbi:MAG: patatin-like phospholipase family protein, partial [Pseudomonadota bacterium]